MADLHVVNLGLVEYREALELQHRFADARAADAIADTVLMLEHPLCYTRGRRTPPGELTLPEAWYRERGIDIVDVDRGGKVTHHAPGQLVAYPIMRVESAREHVARMERAIVAALADEGVPARGRSAEGPAWTGVWVGEAKIASIGVHVSRGITTHGLAINVDNDLEPWSWIVPCGLPGVRTTSVAEQTGATGARLPCLRKRLAWRFAQECGMRQRIVSRERALAPLLAPAV
ncbi:lipoyl(octanoyl) transferase LipB [Capillimicrobium parvum]|jgi:lipoyl(octanoyl) transferase|uniref:Octanoyltransferase n=1 Tax=Capillimicrobium parvum TaxID=2884022 RepID=A0A9E7BYW6_9ACTN|nr:lipoyl(octanoyl) transferase LipB [Capillimicrobium parvum]UGS33929.1 Octanoyltransferase [Capillimicrobium parvum]